MPAQQEQVAYATVAKRESRTALITFDRPTKPGSCVTVVVSAAGALPVGLPTPVANTPGVVFTRLGGDGLRDIEAAAWCVQNCPPISQITVGYNPLTPRSIQARAFEHTGVAQGGAAPQVIVRRGESSQPWTGTLTPAQADSLVLAFVISQYDTAIGGFVGNLARLFESISPQRWERGTNVDWERSRLVAFQAVTTAVQVFSLFGYLAVARRWITILICFRGTGSGTVGYGPLKLSTRRDNDPAITVRGSGNLTLFGKLVSRSQALTVEGGAARISPSVRQFRLGGWSGLLIGHGTDYGVEGTDGLYGWQVRTSDDDLPRGDGALRGVDLASARQVVFKLNMVGVSRDEKERLISELYRALVPRRDEDWELLWRRPTEPLKMMRVRPVDLNREIGIGAALLARQTFALRAADPRHYAAVPTTVRIPNTAGTGDPTLVQVTNIGNAPAYPTITIRGPSSGPAVTQVELVNRTALTTFGVTLTLPRGSTVVGDMEGRVTGAPRSAVTLDGQSKYGAWNLPRDPFRIEPDPDGMGGYNDIYLRTEPAGAPVECVLTYRHTWSG